MNDANRDKSDDSKRSADSIAGASASFFLDNLSVGPDGQRPTDIPLPPDTEDFHFIRELGRGGMGVVYEAEDKAADRKIALKVIIPSLQLSSDMIERFDREARAAASISHPHCVFVFGAHVAHGSPAIAMELMPGKTLDEALKKDGGIPIDEAIDATLDLLSGLEAAHDNGVIHRDIKPSNLFLDPNNRVKLGDFGLSRSFEGDLGITRTGMYLGTPLYSSPEQVRGQKVDRRSDIYSVGAVFYALLTGRPPYQSSSIGDLFAQIATEVPTNPREVNPEIPRGIDAIIMKAMAKQPKDRYRDARAMRRALQSYSKANLKPAPRGRRLVAFAIDIFIIGFTLSPAIAIGTAFGPESPNFALAMALLETLLATLYFALFDAFMEGTPGKYSVGLRVRAVGGGRLSFPRSFLRAALICLTDLARLASHPALKMLELIKFGYLLTIRRSNGWRGLHEFASGSRTVLVSSRLERLLQGHVAYSPGRDNVAALPELAKGYKPVAFLAKTDRGRLYVAREERLRRRVWFHALDPGARASDPKERSERDDARLRWLAAGDGFDVYEDPAGASPQEYASAKRVSDWEIIRDVLSTLPTLESSRPITDDRLWIDGRGQLRLLDFRIRHAEASDDPAETASSLVRNLTGFGSTSGDRPPRYLPEGGAKLLRKIESDRDFELSGLAKRLEELGDATEPPSRALRLSQLGITFLIGLFGILAGFGFSVLALASMLDISVESFSNPDATIPYVALGVGVTMTLFLPNFVFAWLFRRGPGHAAVGISIHGKDGDAINRKAATWRCFWAYAPVLSFIWLGVALTYLMTDPWMMLIGAGLAGAYIAANATYAVFFPDSSLHDRWLGTRLVH